VDLWNLDMSYDKNRQDLILVFTTSDAVIYIVGSGFFSLTSSPAVEAIENCAIKDCCLYCNQNLSVCQIQIN